jgi:Zn-dependent peptidase ImmA (M78 family)
VKNALFDDVENLVEKTGQKTPPVKPEIVAKERKVIEIETAALDTDALIVPCRGGFLMKINEKLPVVRQRFACAHEIAHTYFFDLEKDPPCKPYKSHTRGQPRGIGWRRACVTR